MISKIFLCVFFSSWVSVAWPAAPAIGLALDPVAEGLFAEEWAWALRGGGAELKRLGVKDLEAPLTELALLVLDAVPLSVRMRQGLDIWVRNGGLLIYAGANAAMETLDERGRIRATSGITAAELLGVRFAGYDPGLIGAYPVITASTSLLSPLLPGDGLRLGQAGLSHKLRLEEAGDAVVLARALRWSPGPGKLYAALETPTIVTHRHGQGRVVFLSFSPGQVAACYPESRYRTEPTDCSGAGSAHALMRWLTANLLWEERRQQIPLLWEAPGDRPHGFIVTGDVHVHPDNWEIKASLRMAEKLNSHGIPLSYYLMGQLAERTLAEIEALHRFNNLELSPHSFSGKVYTQKDFGWLGFGESWGIRSDIRQAEEALRIPRYPDQRRWLLSTRSHGWLSDRPAWAAMRQEGIGLAFDHVADGLSRPAPWRVPVAWFSGDERQRLFVPLYEHSIATSASDFRLPPAAARDIALLASAQPEPFEKFMLYQPYTNYVLRWHGLLGRLARMGGITEVWIWHPGGLAAKTDRRQDAFQQAADTVQAVTAEESVTLLRGDIAAGWRANRERYRISVGREADGSLRHLELLPPDTPPLPLPPDAPAYATTVSYWVLGPLTVPGWHSREWADAHGRVVTVLTRSLPTMAASP